jgi:hypothetical protein
MMELQEEICMPLRKPVKLGEVTYENLDLREPTAGELEKASAAPTQVGQAITLISLVAKMPRSAVEKICQRDLREASDFLGSFSDDSPETGDTSSQ